MLFAKKTYKEIRIKKDMKRNLILRNASVVLTLLTVVSLASCRDQNFDWDEARATEQYQKFTNVFVKEFGKPAEGHQWGFDLADLSLIHI